MAARLIIWIAAATISMAASAQFVSSAKDEEALKAAESAFASRDYARALAELRPLAERGNPRAQNGVGMIYDQGLGVPRNLAAAFAWYLKSAQQGYALAQFNVAVMYSRGEGVAKDASEAANWYRKAAQQGHSFAQHNLALMYAQGEGVPRDATEALRWEKLAAAQGDPNALYNLGAWYATGTAVPRDSAEAFKLFRSAAARGYPLRFDFEAGWVVGSYQIDAAARHTIAEFVREGDDIDHWKELLTIESFPLAPGGSPEDALDAMKARRERECPGTTQWNVIARDAGSILYEWRATPCLGWPDQHEVARIIHARGSSFILHYAVKIDRMPDELRSRWIGKFAAAQ